MNEINSVITRVFSYTTLARFEEIAEQMAAHESNIVYLQAVVEGGIDLTQIGCTAAIRYYRRTKEDEVRLPKTLENLRQQIRLLEHEREVLRKYGR